MVPRFIALAAALTVLASCASAGPVGEVAERAPPPPYAVQVADTAPASGASVAAPGVVAPTAPAAPRRPNADDDIIVPGQVERQVPAPAGDPRTATERMADIRNWDRCVMQGQAEAEGSTRPQLDDPEGVCRQQLGMANRTAVPAARDQR